MSESAVRGRGNAERIAQAIETINANAECLAAYTAAVVEQGKNQKALEERIRSLQDDCDQNYGVVCALDNAFLQFRLKSFWQRLRWLVRGR